MNINKITVVGYIALLFIFPQVSFASPIRVYPSYSDISSICSFLAAQPNTVHLVEKLPGNGWLTGGSGGYFNFGDSQCNNTSSNGWQSLLGYVVANGGVGDFLFIWDFQVYSGGSNLSKACYSAGANNLSDCLSQGTDIYAIGHWDGFVWDFGGILSSTPSLPTISQLKLDGSTLTPEGDTTPEPAVVFSSIPVSPEGNLVKLQVELKQSLQSFNSSNLLESNFVTSGSNAEIVNYVATPGTYHWRARAIDNKGNASAWQEFGVVGNIDFVTINKYEAYGTNKQLINTASETPGARYFDGGANVVYQTLGTGLTGIIDSQHVSFSGILGNGSSSGNISILCSSKPFDESINLGLLEYDCGSSQYVVGSYYGNFNFAHPLWSANSPEWSNILDPSKYYTIKFDNSSNGYHSEIINGSSIDVYSGGQCFRRNFNAPYNAIPCYSVADVFFDLGTRIGDASLSLSTLGQYKSNGVTAISEGADTTEPIVVFSATPASTKGRQVRLQVEFKEINKQFDATNLLESELVDSGILVNITKNSILEGAYHWRARAVDSTGLAGVWQEIGVLNSADVVVTHQQLVFDTTLPSHKDYTTLKFGISPYVVFPSGNSGVINSVSFYIKGATSTDSLLVSFFENFSYTSYYSSYTQFYKNSACSIPAYTPVPLSAGVVNFSLNGLYMRTYPWNSDKGGPCLSATPGYTVSPNSSLTIWAQTPNVTFFGSAENLGNGSCSQGYYGCSPISSLYLSFNDLISINTPTLSTLAQLKSDGATPITESATTTESTLVFGATLSDADNDQVKLQVELKDITQAFDGTNLIESNFVASGSIATTTKNSLTEGAYHWRARAVDDKGNASDWQEFGAVGNTDVILDLASNVLFIPGLMGSRLFENGSDCWLMGGEKERWVSTSDCDHSRLELTPEGKSKNLLYTKEGTNGVIDDAYGANIYQSFMGDLNDWKNKEHAIADYAVIPYDWRLSLEDILQSGATSTGKLSYGTSTAPGFFNAYIYQELKKLVDSSTTGKVTIVAHSNGGLVTKALIQKLKENNDPLYDKIDNVILVAVPQIGTPEAVLELLHGKSLAAGFVMNSERLRALSQNMPTAYNLLPSNAYFGSVGAKVYTPVVSFEAGKATQPFIDAYGYQIKDASTLKSFLISEKDNRQPSLYNDLKTPSTLNANLISFAERVHQSLDGNWNFSTSTSVYQIAGWGEDTLETINYRSIPGCDKVTPRVINGTVYYNCTQWGSHLTFDPKETIDGDGTVVTPSALAMSTSAERVKRYWVDLREYDRLRYGNIERTHSDIFEIKELRILVKNFIIDNSSPTTPFTFVFTSEPKAKTKDDRLVFRLHSPLNLSVTDSLGNSVNSATSTIPGGSFARYGEVQVVKVPKGVPVTVNLNGYDSGSFALDIEEIDGMNVVTASSTIVGVPSATSTVAMMTFPQGVISEATPLLVDYDGNGVNDFTIGTKAGEVVTFDTTPPEARISFSTSTKSLLIEGFDEGGATTVHTTATSSVVVDEVGNTLEVLFKKSKQEKHEIKLQIQEIRYNGVVATTTQKTSLQYEWSADKAGNIKELEQKIEVGELKVEAHYNAKKNVTEIKTKSDIRNGKHHNEDNDEYGNKIEKKEILPGLVVVGVKTEKGTHVISY